MSHHASIPNIRKIVRIEAKAGLADQMRAALLELERATRPEPGCREFMFFQALDNPGLFLLVEDFANAAALEEHMKLPHTQKFFSLGLAASVKPIDPAWMS
ncbi:quinol monooxygenase YgiN [Microvirga flocculans]|uniref:Quinol monooxygenase YgiN n=1 Tax=Microvirga flocculans TaxID=217168 RepID=A0A7W6N7H1_9HYPH|nr:putative quinol monooxygenase [Microvirga flocculans]MBB4039662.1 quinol monooxygenase YgiN [Microvirga flocculans]